MRYVPLPVIEGFTIGIGSVIALQQVPAALGDRIGRGRRCPVKRVGLRLGLAG